MLTMLSAGCSAVSLKYMAVSRLDTAAGKIPGAGMAAEEVRKDIRTGLESYAQDPEVTSGTEGKAGEVCKGEGNVLFWQPDRGGGRRYDLQLAG